MKKVSLLLLAAATATCAYAQKNPAAVKYSQYISVADAKKHLSIIASDAFEGRETGKPGAEKAAAYIAAQFKAFGLQAPVKGSYFLEVPLVENTFKVSKFTVDGASFTNGKDFYTTSTAAANTVNASDIVFIGYGISDEKYDDLKDLDIAGKVVIYFNDGEPMKNGVSVITGTATKSQWSLSRGKRNQALLAKKPAMILAAGPVVVSNLQKYGTSLMQPKLTLPKDATASTGNLPIVLSITPDVASQILKSTGKTYAQLKAEIDSTGTPKTKVVKANLSVAYGNQVKNIKSADVLGFLPGSDPKLKKEV
jgi:sorbitol-specific phosphotransferase system component IIA